MNARRVWIGTWLLLAGAATGAAGQEPSLRVQATRVMLPVATAEVLDAGRLASDPARGAYELELEVIGGDPARGWAVYLSAGDSNFQPAASGLACGRLRWKLDEESERAWRALDENETILLENPGGGDARITLDLSVDLGWEIEPGTYSLGLLFRVANL